jgi:hypothetical protein
MGTPSGALETVTVNVVHVEFTANALQLEDLT